MLMQEVPGVRTIQNADEFSESRLEAIGFIFHGTSRSPTANATLPAPRQTAPLRPLLETGEGRRDGDQDLVPLHSRGSEIPGGDGRQAPVEVVQGLRTRDHSANPGRGLGRRPIDRLEYRLSRSSASADSTAPRTWRSPAGRLRIVNRCVASRLGTPTGEAVEDRGSVTSTARSRGRDGRIPDCRGVDRSRTPRR